MQVFRNAEELLKHAIEECDANALKKIREIVRGNYYYLFSFQILSYLNGFSFPVVEFSLKFLEEKVKITSNTIKKVFKENKTTLQFNRIL